MGTNAMIYARFAKSWSGFSLNVDLQLPGVGVTALFGHSGSGKTTLLRCLAGLGSLPLGMCQFKGEVWQDENTYLPSHKRPIGYVFQDANLFPHLSVLKNLKYGQARSQQGKIASLEQAIGLLGIEHLLQRKPGELSGGEKQRVGIARALAVNPRLLLMDEPLAALDLARKQEILPYLENLHGELKIPILYVSHSPDEVARLADHIVVMADGRALAQGPLVETLSRIDLPIRLGEEAGVVLEGEISQRDQTWSLMQVAFPGGSLWAKDIGHPVGHKARIRVLARDVSISLQQQHDTSIQNHFHGIVDSIQIDEHPGLTLVRVCVGTAILIARLTTRAAHELQITSGKQVWLQVKSVALVE
ncbi:molybdenum ABC transporter ATP-binding protein [Pseudaeromonas sharmana]|uniref:Molybdenum ABC transporter ATP-binding protein n=1 Tax=Pseudaeromonas sharmana TaxID=328412 RepID=A0ABV8CM95_9GAMM